MRTIEVKAPSLGDSIETLTLTWIISEGEFVSEDDVIAEFSCEYIKCAGIPAPAKGVVEKIFCCIGETVEVRKVLALIKKIQNEN